MKKTEQLIEEFGGLDELVYCAFLHHVRMKTIAAHQFAQAMARNWNKIEPRIKKLIKQFLVEKWAAIRERETWEPVLEAATSD